MFAKDKNGKSSCSGGCSKFWPPSLKSGKATAGSGVKAALIGTTKRSNGSLQLTYNKHPALHLRARQEGRADERRRPARLRCQVVRGVRQGNGGRQGLAAPDEHHDNHPLSGQPISLEGSQPGRLNRSSSSGRGTSASDSSTRSASSSASVAVIGFGTATHASPADFAALTPFGESSKAIASSAGGRAARGRRDRDRAAAWRGRCRRSRRRLRRGLRGGRAGRDGARSTVVAAAHDRPA